jgi:hypothetical protein
VNAPKTEQRPILRFNLKTTQPFPNINYWFTDRNLPNFKIWNLQLKRNDIYKYQLMTAEQA